MRILVNGATSTLERFKDSPAIGALMTPAAKNAPHRVASWGLPFGVDNGAWGGFKPAPFLRLLSKLPPLKASCLFVAAPDVVGDATETLRQFSVWGPLIRELGLPTALVGQDGLEHLEVPWSGMDALFIGGSTKWKLSRAAAGLCAEAKRRGLHVHVGRVNSYLRIRAAMSMGADTVDGSNFTWWPDTHIPRGIEWVSRASRQLAAWREQGRFVGDVLGHALDAAQELILRSKGRREPRQERNSTAKKPERMELPGLFPA